jgi:hypothetical protein
MKGIEIKTPQDFLDATVLMDEYNWQLEEADE